MDTHDTAESGAIQSHIEPASHYYRIFAALIVLTLLTVALSYVHLGPANLAIAILIASIKASLVVVFFMHLRHDNAFNATIFICGVMFIGIFFAYTANDTFRRQDELNDVSGNKIYLGESEKQAPGGFEPPKHIVDGVKAHTETP